MTVATESSPIPRRWGGGGSHRIRRMLVMGGFALAVGGGVLATSLALRAPADPVCTDYWIGGTGSWSTASNWSTHAVPTSADTACVTQTTGSSPAAASDTYTVTLNNNATVGALVVGSGNGTGVQTVQPQGVTGVPSTLTMIGSSLVRSNGVVALDSTDSVQPSILGGAGPLVNNGTVSAVADGVASRRIEVPLTNNGTVDLAAAVKQDINTATVNGATGTWRTETTGSFSVTSGSFDNQGAVADLGSFTASGMLFTQEGTANTGNAILLNAGVTLTDSAGTGGFLTHNNNSLVGTVPSGQTITVQGITGVPSTLTMNAAVTNNGTLVLDSTDTVQPSILAGNGLLTNNGALNAIPGNAAYRAVEINLTNSVSGTVDVAAADTRQDRNTTTINNGTWTIEPTGTYKDTSGTWSQGSTGTFAVSLNATGAATGLTGGDAVSLDGTLKVTTTGSPTVGQQFTIIGTGPVSGQFAHYQFGGSAYTVLYKPTSVVLTVPVQLVVTTTTIPGARVGVAYAPPATLSSSGGSGAVTWSVTTGALPDGLTLNGATGSISGTPAADAVTEAFTVTATDSGVPAQAVPANLSIAVLPHLPTVTTTSLPAGQVGVPYPANTQLAAAGGTAPYSWSVSGGALPAGLSLDPNTGAITGTPTAGAVGTAAFIVTVTDSELPAQTGTAHLSITVTPPGLAVATASLPAGTVGVAYPANTNLAANGGTPPYSWSVTSGSLPGGLTLDASTGAISGTPVLSSVGTASFTATVTDSQTPTAQTANANLSITVLANPVSVTTSALPAGRVGTPYPANTILTAAGGVRPYSWSLTTGALPAGLSLNPSGLISGTPTAAAVGTASFRVTVTDSLAPAPQGAAADLSITVSPPPLAITTSSLPADQVGSPYPANTALAATGGTAPYSWAVTTGALPAGLTLDTNSGAITGTPSPSAVGTASFTVTVTDSQIPTAQTASANLTITVTPNPVSLTTTSLPAGQVGSAYPANTTLAATGGTAPYSWSVTTGALPAGLTLDANTGTISGTPAASSVGTATFTVTVTDSQTPTAQTATANLSITITPAAAPTTVSGVSPQQGNPLGGTGVTITGSGFTGATGVTFGTAPATGVTVLDDATIVATAPAGTNYRTVDVTVTGPGGVSATSSADQFSYTDWVAVALAPVPNLNLAHVACASPTRCTAFPDGVARVYFFDGFTWTGFTGPGAASSSFPLNFSSVSCVSVSDCTAVGSENPSGSLFTVIDHYNGTSWTQVSSVNPSIDPSLSGVSCLSSNFCMAVGGFGNVTTDRADTLVERFNGTTWTQMVTPPLPGGDALNAVTCITTNDCTAVGVSLGTGITGLIEHYNGSKWSVVAAPYPNVASSQLFAVSCTSATNCTASAPGFALHFDGTAWSTLPAPAAGRLSAVSCASVTDCTGVGTASPGNAPSGTLIEHYDGTGWTPFLAPSPNADDYAYDVDCRSATFCALVGGSGPTLQGGFITTPQPLIEMRAPLQLQASVAFPSPGQPDTLTATSPIDVASLGAALDIVDSSTGKVVGTCPSGTTCTASVTLSGSAVHTYVAEIGTARGTNVTALSAPLVVNTSGFSLSLSASTITPAPGQPVTLTATATSDVGATGSPLRIVDTTTNRTVGSCSSGLTCSTSVAVTTAGVHTYQAAISGKAKISSVPVSITWQATTLSLTLSTASPAAGQAVTLTVRANFNPGAFGTPIKVVDLGSGRTIFTCVVSQCSVIVNHFDGVSETYQATIGGKLQLTTTVTVTWPPVAVTLNASATSPAPKTAVTLTATSAVPLDGTLEALVIVDTTTGKVIATANTGTTVTASVKFASGSHTYAAQARWVLTATVQVTSTPLTVTW